MPAPSWRGRGNLLNLPVPPDRLAQWQALVDLLRRWPRVVVLLSGGVDSACLLRAAAAVLGPELVAVTFTGPHIPAEEVAAAAALARSLQVRHRVEAFDPFHLPPFRLNTPARCYACKQALYRRAGEIARQEGAVVVLDGANATDAGDDRPGLRAAQELGIRSPLREAGWDKAAIREISRLWGLPTWDRPAQSCLATRFPTGTPISPTDLKKVEQIETWLRQQGCGPVRLRVHGDLVRLELPPEQWPLVLEPEVRAALHQKILAQGWRFLTLDLAGYQSGSMNVPVPEPAAAPSDPDIPPSAALR